MNEPKRNLTSLAGPAILVALLGAGLTAVIADRPCSLSAGQPAVGLIDRDPLSPGDAVSDQAPAKAARAAVEKLASEQKLEAAAAECARLRGEARKAGHASLWTAAAPSPAKRPVFTEVTAQSGITWTRSFGDHDLSNIVEGTGSGACVFDYDGDGKLDVYFPQGRWEKTVSDNRGRDSSGSCRTRSTGASAASASRT